MARPQKFDRETVLQKSMQLFWQHGYEGTSLADILQVTGISKSSLYNSFDHKYGLFLEAFDKYRQDRYHDMIKIFSNMNARTGIECFFRMIITDARNPEKGSGCMGINQAIELAPYDKAVKQRIREDFNRFELALTLTIERGQKDGTITTRRDARILASLLVLGFPGLQIFSTLAENSEILEHKLFNFLTLLD